MSIVSLEVKNGITSLVMREYILDKTSIFDEGKTGLTYASSGLVISTIADNEAAPTRYTQAASHIEDITTLGTYAAPSASKCRFKEVDSIDFKGLYELQIANARWAISGARYVDLVIPGVSGLGTIDRRVRVQLVAAESVGGVDVGSIAGSTDAAAAQRAILETTYTGTVDVVTSRDNFTVTFDNFTGAVMNALAARTLRFNDGDLIGSQVLVTGFDYTTNRFTCKTLADGAPTNGDHVVVI